MTSLTYTFVHHHTVTTTSAPVSITSTGALGSSTTISLANDPTTFAYLRERELEETKRVHERFRAPLFTAIGGASVIASLAFLVVGVGYLRRARVPMQHQHNGFMKLFQEGASQSRESVKKDYVQL